MINLLPPREKKELAERETQKLIIIWSVLISLFFISLIFGLLSIKFYLSGQLAFQTTLYEITKEELNTQKNQELKKEIRNLNKDITRISSFYKSKILLTEILKRLVTSLPSTVVLYSLTYQRDNSSIILTGFAKNREALLSFRDNLEKEKIFSEVFFPPSNWVKPEDITLFVTIKLSSSK